MLFVASVTAIFYHISSLFKGVTFFFNQIFLNTKRGVSRASPFLYLSSTLYQKLRIMGLPMYKPRDEHVASEKHQAKDLMEDGFWSIFPHQLHNHGNIRRPSRASNNHHHPHHLVSRTASNVQPRVSRIARRRSMLTSSLLDRRRDSRIHQLPGTVTTATLSSSSNTSTSASPPSSSSSSSSSSASASPPMRSELNRHLHQRITEKEDLLEQLRVTVSLLDQFLSARAALGGDMSLPSFITEGTHGCVGGREGGGQMKAKLNPVYDRLASCLGISILVSCNVAFSIDIIDLNSNRCNSKQ